MRGCITPLPRRQNTDTKANVFESSNINSLPQSIGVSERRVTVANMSGFPSLKPALTVMVRFFLPLLQQGPPLSKSIC